MSMPQPPPPPPPAQPSRRYLVYGGRGWIGGMLLRALQARGDEATAASARIEDLQQVRDELDRVRPTHVLMAAGLTGRPNVGWCEAHKAQTLMANVAGLLNVAHACCGEHRGIHCTVFGSGCVYESAADATAGFTEDEPPNFAGSYYSRTKAAVQAMLAETYGGGVLLLRLRMPITDDLHPRSFPIKLARYERVVDVPNSVSVLRELLPIALGLSEKKATGVYNLVNPGAVSHNEVLALYRDLVDPGFTWKNMTLEEQAAVIVGGRSNCTLSTAKLEAAAKELGLPLSPAREALVQTMKNIRLQLPLDWRMEAF